jgi:D-glycero-D-manno-heptose 1,7-bisphosphate phosphatase
VKLAILDRDGVINQDSPDFVKSPDEWVALPGSLDAIARLSRAGWRVVIASNQSGIARGLFSMDTLNAIHAKMRREVAQAGGLIDAIFVCPHGPDDGCHCRKPAPGLFEDIGRRYEVNLTAVPAAGDSLPGARPGWC